MATDKEAEERVIAFLRERYPDLFSCNEKELLKKTKDALWQLEVCLHALQDRKVDPGWWSPKRVLDEIEPITEEYGWEGVGR
jgi:hypothetical protein